MDHRLRAYVESLNTPFNDDVCRGLAYKESSEIPASVDALINECVEHFPPGLVYKGSRRALPRRHFDFITRQMGSKRVVDISRHDYYLMEYFFAWEGEDIPPIGILLPYISEGGIITHRDATYTVSPAVCSIGYSIMQGKIFIQLSRARYNFQKQHHQVMQNNARVIGSVYWAPIHHMLNDRKHKPPLKGDRKRIDTSLAHYLFAKCGFVQAVKKYAGADVVVKRREDSDKVNYPKDDWDAFSSYRLSTLPHPNANVTIYVKREDMEKNGTYLTTLCTSFFYTFDAFTDEFDTLSDVNVPTFWQRLLGNIILGDHEHRGQILAAMEGHMHSVDMSLDNPTREALRHRDVMCDDMYDFFSCIMSTLSGLFIQTREQGSCEASAYGKRLNVKTYLLEEINNACTSIVNKFQTESNRGKTYRYKDIQQILTTAFKATMCINNLPNHGEISLLGTPNASMIHQSTANVVDQGVAGNRTKSGKASKGGLINDPQHKVHVSLAEVYQYTNCAKRMPDGRGKINPTVLLSPSHCIMRKPHLREMLDAAQRKLDER